MSVVSVRFLRPSGQPNRFRSLLGSKPWHSVPTAFVPFLQSLQAGSATVPTRMDRVEVERMAHTIHMLMHWAVLAWQTLPYPPRNIPNEVVNLFDRGNDDDFGPDAPVLLPRAKAKAKAKTKAKGKAKAKAKAKVHAKANIGKARGGDKPDGSGGGGGDKRDGKGGKKAVK